jgi:putative inorganic carbon (HCO3(-)) transporter
MGPKDSGVSFAGETRRDKFAFAMIVVFVVQMYSVPGEWIEWMNPLRIALVASGLAAGAMLLRRIGKAEPLSIDGLRGMALLALLGLAFASRKWSVAPDATQDWALSLLKLGAIYFTIVNVVTTPRRLFIACAALVLASIATSIGTINWYRAGVDLVEGFRARWVGVYADPNHLAEDLEIIVPIAVAMLARREVATWLRALCGLATVLALIAMVETHSRGGSIGLSVALVIWAFREQRKLQAVIVGLALFLGLAIFAPKSFWEREQTVGDFHEDASAMGRVYAWNVASKISVDKPLLGVGGGGFRFAWPLYAPVEAKKAYVAHNIYLDTIGELGFVGLFCFLIFTGGATGGAFASGDDPEVGWLGRALAASVAGYIVCNFFSGDTISAHLYVLFGLASAVERIACARLRKTSGVPDTIPMRLGTARALGG